MIVYKADRLLTTGTPEILERAAVLVEEDKIVWVGSQADWEHHAAHDYAEAVELGDKTLMPGLIDAHVHLGFDGSPAPVKRLEAETDLETVPLMVHTSRQLLSVGVTTARDLGARGYTDLVVRDAFASGTLQGPRLLTAG
ncbi:MAG: amidohydrolase family protein, partial [Propionibacterium sp.]|nr:amidohydrolase family protein [Propionibacterium sp.]